MDQEYRNYSNNRILRLFHRLQRVVRDLPIRGSVRASRMLWLVAPTSPPTTPCLVQTMHGFPILVDPSTDRGLERSVFFSGTYEEGTLNVMSAILEKGRGTFIDVGANIGLMTLHAACLLRGTGDVLSFEPVPATYSMLLRNLSINRLENVKAVNAAVGSTEALADVYENVALNRGAASLIQPSPEAAAHKTFIVPLDSYVHEHHVENINCIKIDVEGWELEVLQGAIETLSDRDAPACIIECSTLRPMYGGGVADIYRFMSDVNEYRMFQLAGGKEKRSALLEVRSADGLRVHDNLFCLLPKHLANLPQRLFT